MPGAIEIHGTHFICAETKRVLHLRGVSLSGSSKLPIDLPSHTTDIDAFFDSENVSYVGRPFPLEEMDEHLSRIRDWGFRLVRLVVTWEALEHSGWQKYDKEYIEYIRTIVEALPKYGLWCMIDAHQDVFSRLTGGSGAPGWAVSLIGFDARNLVECQAAHLHPLALETTDPPPSVWPSGYQKLAAATCNTIFWAGDAFAPKRKAPDGSGRGLSTFLQDAMSAAFAKLADRLEGLSAVLGFEPMNEPHRGYLECQSIYSFDEKTDLQIGFHPSPLQSFALGDGYAQNVPYYVKSFPRPTKISHKVRVNTAGQRAWKEGSPCIWREHGVWEWNERKQVATVLCQDYFKRFPATGERFEWYKDAWYPFVCKFSRAVSKGRAQRQHWMTFAGSIPNEWTPSWPTDTRPQNLVASPHFYDLHTLFFKTLGNISYNVQGLSRGLFVLKALHFGSDGLQNNYTRQLGNVVSKARQNTQRPCLVSEIGAPFDINGFSTSKNHDWRWQERQIDALCAAAEQTLVSYVLWNYNPDNNDEHGDSWYMENFSIFSKSMPSKDGKGAGRCVDMFQRPYARATPGIPVRMEYNPFTLAFVYQFILPSAGSDHPEAKSKVVEIYLPGRRYTTLLHEKKAVIQISDGTWQYLGKEQLLQWTISDERPGGLHTIHVYVPDERHHRIKPSNIDLAHLSAAWALTLFAILLPAFVYGVFYTFEVIDIWTR